MDGLVNYNTLVVLAGTGLLGAGAGAVGTFTVLRRRALTGDALAHAALPGLCLAFLAWGERNTYVMLAGALATGIVGVATIAGLRRGTRIKEDAAIGIVLSVFFGAGIVLSRLIQNQATGGSKAGLESYVLGKTAGMTADDVYLIAAASGFCLLVVLAMYKEFKLISFDTPFGKSQGWPVLALDLVMMSLLAIMVVIGLPSVGVVLIAALLILPAVAARFWTARLSRMILLSSALGAVIGLVGTALSAHFSMLPTGPIMVLVGSTVFLISMLAAPRRGLITRGIQQRRFAELISQRLLLHDMYEGSVEQSSGQPVRFEKLLAQSRGRERALRAALQSAIRGGDIVEQGPGQYVLTPPGRERAADVTRELRLWEAFLNEHADQAVGLHHLPGDPVAEVLPAEVVEELTRGLARQGRLPSAQPRREGLQ